MTYLVLCNDHANLLFHMNRFREHHKDCFVYKDTKEIKYAGDTYIFFAKTENANTLLSYIFDALMIPPGYNWFDNVEVVAMSRVRFRNVDDSRQANPNY